MVGHNQRSAPRHLPYKMKGYLLDLLPHRINVQLGILLQILNVYSPLSWLPTLRHAPGASGALVLAYEVGQQLIIPASPYGGSRIF